MLVKIDYTELSWFQQCWKKEKDSQKGEDVQDL